jgi:hypothetical protein
LDGSTTYWQSRTHLPQHLRDLLARHGSEARCKVLDLDGEVTALVTLTCARVQARR